MGDFRNREAGITQKLLAFFDPVFEKILENRGAGHPLEEALTFFRAEADFVGDCTQGDFLRVMRLQVVKNLFQAAVGGGSVAVFIGIGVALMKKSPNDGPERKQNSIDLERTFRGMILGKL